MAQAVETSRPLIDERGHQVVVQVPSDPVWIRGDAVRLSQAISNLLNNAAKYTPDGGHIRLTLELRDSRAILTVADNGLGLSAEMLDRVFDLFAQFESDDRARGGLGIGLTLVKRLIGLHGGDVEARSAGRGHGSEFIVRLPVWQGQAELPSVVTVGAIPRPSTRRRVLVVDDNVDAAEGLSRILELEGQDVCVAHDGKRALAMAAAMQPEIVFLDLGMPKMSGFEVARRLRTEWSARPLLLVAITGFGHAEDRRRTAEAGFDHHLVKPIDGRQLRSVLASVT
jgi:CheY-like chemotaxis protein